MNKKNVRLLTDSAKKREQAIAYLERRKTALSQPKKHIYRSDNEKIEVVKTYLALGGNAALTASTMGVNVFTIHSWKKTKWWNDLVTQIQKQEKLELSVKTKKLIDKSLDLLVDRLENGDFIYDQKKGELIRKPLIAKDINKIANDMFVQKDVLDKATVMEQEVVGVEDKLLKLAEQFAKLANKVADKKPIESEIVDVEFVEKGN